MTDIHRGAHAAGASARVLDEGLDEDKLRGRGVGSCAGRATLRPPTTQALNGWSA
jgi:hypothetical protein